MMDILFIVNYDEMKVTVKFYSLFQTTFTFPLELS